MTLEDLLEDAYQLMRSALQAGDWKPDGACDPYLTLDRIEQKLWRTRKIKLSENEQAVLEYLKEPKSAMEVAQFLGHKLPPYNILRLLRRLDLVDKISEHERAKATFVQSGRPMLMDVHMQYRGNI
jgi:hypothetical protein